MHPNLLLGTRAEGADPENILHLGVADEQGVARDEEPDALAARRASQAAAVSPHLLEIVDLPERLRRSRSAAQAHGFVVEVGEALVGRGDGGVGAGGDGRGAVGGGEGRLREEGAVAADARIDADREYGALVAVLVDVHEVQFRFAAVALHAVVGRRVDVPGDEVDGLVDAVLVEGKARSVQVDGAVVGGGAGGAGRFG